MIRRRHRKSRQGCLECKRRHMKCDENRPVCANCSISERECSFRGNHLRQWPRTTRSSPFGDRDATSRPDESENQHPPRLSQLLGLVDSPTDCDLALDDDINFRHVELLLHFSISISIPELDEALSSTVTKLVFDTGLEAPYLLYEALAISARHLAAVTSSPSPLYLQQATGLQRKAIARFNSLKMHIDKSNCVPALLFSSILGRHFLADTLADSLAAKRHQFEFPSFVDRYVQYVRVHRGVQAVASLSWPFLLQSELQPLLSWGSGLAKLSPRGRELSELTTSVAASSTLDKDAIEACLGSIRYLQVGLDHLSSPASRRRGLQVMFNWPVLSPIKFIELLTLCQPEALVILGHYAVLLHLGKDMWQIGDSGRHILDGIAKHLGAKWAKMLSWPLSVIGQGVGDLNTADASQDASTVNSQSMSP